MSRVPSTFRGGERDRVEELLRDWKVEIPEPDPVTIETWPGDPEPLVVYPDRPDIIDLADAIDWFYREATATYPGRRNWRRWRMTQRVASFLYVTGITSSGGSSGGHGDDPIGGWIHTLPKFDLHHRRPYVLWKPAWWWQCHRRQGLTIRGRHKPLTPMGFGICAACLPCPTCGAPYECEDDCTEMIEVAS